MANVSEATVKFTFLGNNGELIPVDFGELTQEQLTKLANVFNNLSYDIEIEADYINANRVVLGGRWSFICNLEWVEEIKELVKTLKELYPNVSRIVLSIFDTDVACKWWNFYAVELHEDGSFTELGDLIKGTTDDLMKLAGHGELDEEEDDYYEAIYNVLITQCEKLFDENPIT